MKTYDPESKCPKCGNAKASAGFGYHGFAENNKWPYIYREVLDRKCLRCGYTWMEAPLDAKEEKPDV